MALIERTEYLEDMVSNAIVRVPFEARTWREGCYLMVSSMVGFLGALYLLIGFAIGLSLVVILVGIPLLALLIIGGRSWGTLYRSLSESLLRSPVPPPPRFRAGGTFGFVGSGLSDRVGWRALIFLAIESVLSWVSASVILTFAAVPAFLVVSPVVWLVIRPINYDSDGVAHQSVVQIGSVYFDTLPQMSALAAVGILGLFLAPWPIRALASVERFLIGALLGPTQDDDRVAHLESSRAAIVDDSSSTLRRVERDLHDGAQARLVTMAMALGRAEEKLARGEDASDLVAAAHGTAKDALAELREVVRGIHPPALDLGIEAALQTLCSRSAVPVELSVLLPTRPDQSIETIAYFTVAELLTNVAKHASASTVWIDVHEDGETMVITVRDNGIGGATIGGGTGLTGLLVRAGSVDGTLRVDSPVGGPTAVTVQLPMTSEGSRS